MNKYKKYLPFIAWLVYALIDFSSSYAQYLRQSQALALSDKLTVGGIKPIYHLAGFVAFYDEIFWLLIAFCIFFYIHRTANK